MIHEPLDIAHWKSFFALERLQKEAQGQMPEANIISGPYDIAVIEQLRDTSYGKLPGIVHVPTDIFIWSQGEPEQRAITKIGGLPYRRANQPWPVSPSGIPLTFAAQLCFIDSRDIIPPLLGDILLIFTEAKPYTFRGETFYDFMGEAEADSYLVFEWVSLPDSPLIAQHDIPASPLQIMPCYGSIYRTWDYPHVDGFGYPDIAEHIPPVLEATKIGGICPWREYETRGTEGYLCSLSSPDNEISLPFPFLNIPAPIRWEEWSNSNRLMIGDVGLINLFLNQDGSLRWSFHTH